jgi:hypothetical protein
MHHLTDITLDDRFVIHILDNRLPQLQLSQSLTPMPKPIYDQIRTYIQSILRPTFKRKRFARFRPQSAVLEEYRQLLRDVDQNNGQLDASLFLHVSQRIAARLFDAMQSGQSDDASTRPGDITPGDLMIGLFYADEPLSSSNLFLYLIKIDLHSGFQRQKQERPNGRLQTLLQPCDDLLPRIDMRHIQKTALLRFANDPDTFDVIMTDPQGGKQEIAKFFADAFLATDPFYTPDEQAELLFQRTHSWLTQHEAELSPQERQGVLQNMKSFLTESLVSPEPVMPRDLVSSLPLSEARPAELVAELRQSFEETITTPEGNGSSIPADRQLFFEHLPPQVTRKRITYQLDHGVQLSGDEEAIQSLFTVAPHQVEQDTEFTIRTTIFRPTL